MKETREDHSPDAPGTPAGPATADRSDESSAGTLLDDLTSALGLLVLEHVHAERGPLSALRRFASGRARAAARRLGKSSVVRRLALAEALHERARIDSELRRIRRLEKRLTDRREHHEERLSRSAETARRGPPLESALAKLDVGLARERQDVISGGVVDLERRRGRLEAELEAVEESVGDLREALDVELAQRLSRRRIRRGAWAGILAAGLLVAVGLFALRARTSLAPGPVRPLLAAREHAEAVALPGGGALVIAGIADGEAIATIERFDPRTRAFRALRCALPMPTFNHALASLTEEHFLVTGGERAFPGPAYRQAVLIDARGERATEVGLLTFGRRRHRMVRLEDGRIFAIGGEDDPRAPDHSTIEEFDPATGSFRVVADLPIFLQDFSATVRNETAVVLLGGQSRDRKALARAFLFETRDGTVRELSPLHVARYDHTATALPDGRIVVAGGFGDSGRGLSDVEILDAQTLSPAPAAPMRKPRAFHRAALLGPTGVLVTGGAGGKDVEDEAELYNARADRWLPAGALAEARNNHVMVELEPGVFLLAGGYAATGALRSAEIFVPRTSAGP
ncbi:MAG: kelch repeat-containing protein [Planctomycetota bacterium]